MRTLTISLMLIVSLLSGCASGSASTRNQQNYQTYVNTIKEIEVAKITASTVSTDNRSTQYKEELAACKGESQCVSMVAAFNAMASVVASMASNQNGGNNLNLQAPQREATFGDKALAWAGVLVPGAVQVTGILENGKTSRAISHDNTTLQTAQAQAWSAALNTVASTPSISVGGNYGDTYGDNYTGRDRSEVNNSGVLTSGDNNRVNSPSTGGAGGNCDGGNGANAGNGGSGGAGTGGTTAGTGGNGSAGGPGGSGGSGGDCRGGSGN